MVKLLKKIKMRIKLYFVLLIIISSCKPIVYEETNFFYNYYPLQINQVKEFFVTNIVHNSFGKDTNTYFLKEIITDYNINMEGDTVYTVERYWKVDSSLSYEIKDVWTSKKNLSAGYLNEENITYTKLIFPLSLNIYWNGNAFNNLGYQEYSIESLNIPFQLNNVIFDSSLTVIQNYKSNLLEFENSKEIYATGIGLIYKEDVQVEINSGNLSDITQGYEYYQEIINY
tara:strand:+ start:2061 stop:2744 length:684 start_codon:yes stop_codon:yes gene_type:complete